MRHCLKENSNSFLAMLLSSKRPILLGFLFKIGLNLGDGGGIVFLFFLFFPFFCFLFVYFLRQIALAGLAGI